MWLNVLYMSQFVHKNIIQLSGENNNSNSVSNIYILLLLLSNSIQNMKQRIPELHKVT